LTIPHALQKDEINVSKKTPFLICCKDEQKIEMPTYMYLHMYMWLLHVFKVFIVLNLCCNNKIFK
jgi:hypothetical protein